MHESKFKLNILSKGLILLLVPFALQAALFILLFTQISSAEKLAEQQSIRTDTVEMTTALVEDFGMTWVSIFSHLFGSEKWAGQNPINAEAYRARVSASLAKLKSVPELSNRMKQIFASAEVIGNNQYQILKKVDSTNSVRELDTENVTELVTRMYSLKHDLSKTFAKMNALKKEIDIERAEVQAAKIEDEKRRASIKQLSILFLIFEIILTGILLAFFLYDISKRVNELVTNARRLPEERPLERKISGTDEIAYLDSVLHEASENLLTAKQNRQSMLNMITHDIRSPLMSSNLLLDSLVRKADLVGDEESKEISDRLKETYKQVILLVEDLLSLEKSDAKFNLNQELFDIAQLCQSAADTLSPQAGVKEISIANKVESVNVIADKQRILQVLNNLLTNAIKYSKNAGTIIITSKKDAEFITVFVKDEGPGIEPDDIPHLFEKFFQSRNTLPGQGFGLGLAIAKMVVENHGGKMGVESRPGEGSTFWFSVPVDELG
ncbi:MAG TPA: HAMP domain-containing sensor histidine kinase [Drouetiella sp.]|jgi:signal transduction histidine kinase